MNKKSEYYLDLLFSKLTKNKSRKINLKKSEFIKFINHLINEN